MFKDILNNVHVHDVNDIQMKSYFIDVSMDDVTTSSNDNSWI